MTVIRSTCPRCTYPLEFGRTDRSHPVTAACRGCGVEFVVRPEGMVPLQKVRCLAGV